LTSVCNFSVVYTQLKIVDNIHETALNYAVKCFFSDKNNECLGVNILPQITGNCVSELPDFKNFLEGGACPHTPLEDKGPLAPFISSGRC